MKQKHHTQLYLFSTILTLVLLQNGCSIFSPVGNVISQGYDNTVSYFNIYYNASRLFSEAEDEIRTSELSMRGKTSTSTANQSNQIPGTAKQKLTQVIDKCSYILAFFSASSLVDDALMLIGKSFYYQAEYLKAERKFEELLSSYPKSSLALEAQLWFAFTEEKLGKIDEGINLADLTVAAAKTGGDDEIETKAHHLLGSLYMKANQPDKAVVEFEKCITTASDDEIKSEAQLKLGEIYFKNKQYSMAAEAFLKVGEYTSDIYLSYFSKLQASIAYREIGEYKKELSLIDEMIEDFRNKEYLSALLFERANNYEASGRMADAISEYFYIDTSYAKTMYATQSAYKLGQIYESKSIDYILALKYYAEVNASSGYDFVADGKRKFAALTRYFDAQKRLAQIDSLLLVLQDTLNQSKSDTIKDKNVIQLNVKSDSLITSEKTVDTVKQNISSKVSQPVVISFDSIMIIKSNAAQELGDIFYSEIIVPDSAFYWYHKSLNWNYHPSRSPRILYVLGEHSRTYPDKNYPPPLEYHTRLIKDFPESIYAEEARRFLGKENYIKKTDTAAVYYEQAEKQIDAKQYKKAIETLRKIPISFPKSSLASKSEFAIAWIYETHLAQPESAAVHYKLVVQNYLGTSYAEVAKKRSFEEQKSDTLKSNKITTIDSTDIKKTDQALDGSRKTISPEDANERIPQVLPRDELDRRRKRNPDTKPSDK